VVFFHDQNKVRTFHQFYIKQSRPMITGYPLRRLLQLSLQRVPHNFRAGPGFLLNGRIQQISNSSGNSVARRPSAIGLLQMLPVQTISTEYFFMS
jgi:hypothetical protein